MMIQLGSVVLGLVDGIRKLMVVIAVLLMVLASLIGFLIYLWFSWVGVVCWATLLVVLCVALFLWLRA